MKQETNKTKRTDIFSIDPRNIIVPQGFNSRVNFGDIDELAEQIKTAGMLNPITVQAVKMEDGTEKYQLVDGERRYRAIMSLIEKGEQIKGKDIDYVSAIKVPSNLSKEELYVQQAMRNEGKNFNEFEWATLANKIKTECGKNMSEIAKMLGKNSGLVVLWFQILDMPEKFQNLVRDGKLCGSDLRRIIRANGHDYDKAWKDVEKLQSLSQEKGEKQLSLKNLNKSFDTKTRLFKDSKVLLAGLKILFTYVEHFKEEGIEYTLDLHKMYDTLKEGKLIDEAFNTNLVPDDESETQAA